MCRARCLQLLGFELQFIWRPVEEDLSDRLKHLVHKILFQSRIDLPAVRAEALQFFLLRLGAAEIVAAW